MRRFGPKHKHIEIGSSAVNDIQLRSPTVNRYHVRLSCLEDGNYSLQNLGAVGSVLLNNREIIEHAIISDSSILVVGDQCIEIKLGEILKEPEHPINVRPLILEEVDDWYLLGRGGIHDKRCFAIHKKLSIGCAQDCDLIIDDPFVSSYHVMVEQTKDAGIIARDLESVNGFKINGRRVSSSQLSLGDELEIAGNIFTVGRVEEKNIPTDDLHTESDRPESLLVDGSREKVYLVGKECVIGSEPGCDYHLQAPNVASRHVILKKNDLQTTLIRLPNTPAVYVNDAMVVYATELEDMDRIQIGSEVFVYQADYQDLTFKDSSLLGRRKRRRTRHVFVWLVAIVVMAFGAERLWQINDAAEGEFRQLWTITDTTLNARPVAAPVLSDIGDNGFIEVIVFDAQGQINVFRGQDGALMHKARLPAGFSYLVEQQGQDLIHDSSDYLTLTGDANQIWNLGFIDDGRPVIRWSKDLEDAQIRVNPISVPLKEERHLVIATGAAALVGLNENTGDELWRIDYLPRQTGRVSGLTAVVDSLFHVHTETGQFFQISLTEGIPQIVWNSGLGLQGSIQEVKLITVGGNKSVLIASSKGELIALSLDSGRRLWQSRLDTMYFSSFAAIVQQQTKIFIFGLKGAIGTIDSSSGKLMNTLFASQQIAAAILPATSDFNLGDPNDVIALSIQGSIYAVGDKINILYSNQSEVQNSSYSHHLVLVDINRNGSDDLLLIDDRSRITVLSKRAPASTQK